MENIEIYCWMHDALNFIFFSSRSFLVWIFKYKNLLIITSQLSVRKILNYGWDGARVVALKWWLSSLLSLVTCNNMHCLPLQHKSKGLGPDCNSSFVMKVGKFGIYFPHSTFSFLNYKMKTEAFVCPLASLLLLQNTVTKNSFRKKGFISFAGCRPSSKTSVMPKQEPGGRT